MAGSYRHVVDHDTHSLRRRNQALGMLDTSSGDVYECLEEMYGMIWYLAEALAGEIEGPDDNLEKLKAKLVEQARVNYKQGLVASPTKIYKKD